MTKVLTEYYSIKYLSKSNVWKELHRIQSLSKACTKAKELDKNGAYIASIYRSG